MRWTDEMCQRMGEMDAYLESDEHYNKVKGALERKGYVVVSKSIGERLMADYPELTVYEDGGYHCWLWGCDLDEFDKMTMTKVA